MVFCSYTTGQADEEAGNGAADPNANPRLPPGETGTRDHRRRYHPCADIEGIGCCRVLVRLIDEFELSNTSIEVSSIHTARNQRRVCRLLEVTIDIGIVLASFCNFLEIARGQSIPRIGSKEDDC